MININIDKAKQISHDMRRDKRADLLKQLDIEATIPTLATEAEAKRQVIRDEFAVIQDEIDSAETVNDLKKIVTQF